MDELFDLVITVSDPRVIIVRDVGYAVISDDESKPIYYILYSISCYSILEFSIGFNQTEYTIYEGESITLTVIEYQGFTGGLASGGVPEYRLLGSFFIIF